MGATAMLQAPQTDTVSKTTAILMAVITGIGVWIVRSFLSSGIKAAIGEMLEPKFTDLRNLIAAANKERKDDVAALRRERHDELIEIREVIDKMAERRNLPRPRWSGGE